MQLIVASERIMTKAMENRSAVGVTSSSFAVSVRRGGVDVVDQLADEWRDLCQEAPNDEPFYHPEWIGAHIRAFIPRAKVLVLVVRMDGRLRLLLPFVEERGSFDGVPVRMFRTPVNSHPGRFDIVRSPGPESDAAILAAWEHLSKLPGWDVLQFAEIPEGGVLEALALTAQASGFRTAKIPMSPSPIVPVPTDPELLKQMPRSSSMRSKLRQVRRELSGQGPLHLYRVETADRDALRRFYELESSGWKGEEKSAIACDAKTQQFYDEVAKSAARFGYFCLYMLELNGRLLAAHFGLSSRGTYYSPKIAYDESFKQWAPGHLIVSEILQDCCARGIKTYDITGPNDEWKMKWTTEARPKFTQFIFHKGVLGSLAYMLRFRIRPVLKKSALMMKARRHIGEGEK